MNNQDLDQYLENLRNVTNKFLKTEITGKLFHNIFMLVGRNE
jgi:hypothetical protein